MASPTRPRNAEENDGSLVRAPGCWALPPPLPPPPPPPPGSGWALDPPVLVSETPLRSDTCHISSRIPDQDNSPRGRPLSLAKAPAGAATAAPTTVPDAPAPGAEPAPASAPVPAPPPAGAPAPAASLAPVPAAAGPAPTAAAAAAPAYKRPGVARERPQQRAAAEASIAAERERQAAAREASKHEAEEREARRRAAAEDYNRRLRLAHTEAAKAEAAAAATRCTMDAPTAVYHYHVSEPAQHGAAWGGEAV